MKKGNLVPSEISLTLQPAVTTSGSSIDPRRIEVDRHSLETETSVEESCQEYQRQASPGSQYTTNNNHNIHQRQSNFLIWLTRTQTYTLLGANVNPSSS